MSSLYLNRLSRSDYEALRENLHGIQNGLCFICEQPIDLDVHQDNLDIDHVIPIKLGGKDDPVNFALTHSSCNREKQDSDLNVAKILHKYKMIKDKLANENRGPNLDDILRDRGGAKHQIHFTRDQNFIKYSLSNTGDNSIRQALIYRDVISGFEYCFLVLPIEYLFHDDKINPRSIGQNIDGLVKEFYLKRPQLQISLGWIDITDNGTSFVKVFDGQHKAAAQILLGARELPIRVFINPDEDVLLATNTNAGTKLRQVAFDKSVQRHLGSALYIDRVGRYQKELGLGEDDLNFSEKDLQAFFKGESREIKRYILDAVRDSITHNAENKLKDYIDFGGRQTERPLSYSTIEKTFYSFFIYQDLLDTPLDFKLDQGENARELEKDQILNLMNIIAEELYIGKFDPDIGTRRIENRIQKGEELPLEHIRAFRMSKEEILYNWLRYVGQIISQAFIMQGIPLDDKRLFQYKFPETIWDRIRVFIRNLSNMPVWINKSLSSTVFGGKQNYEYWRIIFETGKSPQGIQVLPKQINLIELVKE